MGLINGLHNVPERFKRCCSSLAPPPTNNNNNNNINITLAFLIFINLKKPKKTQKNPGGLGFFKKTRVFSSPAMTPQSLQRFQCFSCYLRRRELKI